MGVNRIGKQHCFIQKYFDHRRGKSYQDYRCGPLADDAHTGTDFRLPDHAAMARGVAVVAAASGTIRNVRDGMPDVDVRLVGRDAVTDRGLGNVVIVDHGGGWRTIYGHLRRGSVTVSKGQRVATGQKLGLIGLSGITQFPHVHFEVRFAKRSVDPFVGLATHTGCGVGKKVMWHPDLVPRLGYRPTFLLGAGFSVHPMKRTALQYGLYDQATLSRKFGALYFGVFLSGLYTGDRYELQLSDATGRTIRAAEGTVPSSSVVLFRSIGLTQSIPLAAGTYGARYQLTGKREGKLGTVLTVARKVTLR